MQVATDNAENSVLKKEADGFDSLDSVFDRLIASLQRDVSFSEERDREIDKNEAERLKKLREDNFLYSGIPLKYRHVEYSELAFSPLAFSMKDFKGGRADFREVFGTFLADVKAGRPRALWLCGNGGTGKTAGALAVEHELCRAGISCAYFKMHRIMQQFEETKYFASRGKRAQDVMSEVCGPRFRIIDEIGRFPFPDWEQFRLFDISNEVYENGGSSIYISNLSRKELAAFLGAACTDRFRGMSGSYEFDGVSFRGQAGELYTDFSDVKYGPEDVYERLPV